MCAVLVRCRWLLLFVGVCCSLRLCAVVGCCCLAFVDYCFLDAVVVGRWCCLCAVCVVVVCVLLFVPCVMFVA